MARPYSGIGSAPVVAPGAAHHSHTCSCNRCRRRGALEALVEGDLVEGGVGSTNDSVAEDEEMEMAAALLDASSDAELEQLLGGVVRRAAREARGLTGRGQRFLKSGAGRKLVRIGRLVARRALPGAHRAAGTAMGKIAARAGRTFGVELEALSSAEQEYEAARRVVRFTAAATKATVANAERRAPPSQALRSGVVAAAQRHAPGLLQGEDATAVDRTSASMEREGPSMATSCHGYPVRTALHVATQHASLASQRLAYLSSLPDSVQAAEWNKHGSAERRWFGTYKKSRLQNVSNRMRRIVQTLQDGLLVIDCDWKKEFFGRASPGVPDITLGRLWRDSGGSHVDKVQTFVHEAAHIRGAILGGELRQKYGIADALDRADRFPGIAIRTAENIGYYAVCRTGGYKQPHQGVCP